MRVVSVLVGTTVVLFAIVACSSSSDGGSSGGARPEGGTVDPDYCTKYCEAQANSGTLEGSKADCLAQCCKDVPDGCPTTPTDAGHPKDAAVDGTLPGDGGPQAECVTGKDCTSGCCAPATNVSGDPVGPYVCKPNDGRPYDCCNGIAVSCTSPACCVTDANDNSFCAPMCTGNGQCGAARCIGGFTFTSNPFSSCKGPLACGP